MDILCSITLDRFVPQNKTSLNERLAILNSLRWMQRVDRGRSLSFFLLTSRSAEIELTGSAQRFNDSDRKIDTRELEILWEEPSALVVNKPAGLLTQGPIGVDSVEVRLRELLKLRDHHQGVPYIALPHRIDRPVSGALLVARNIRATQRFGAQFQTRKIRKRYWAIVAGYVDDPILAGSSHDSTGLSTVTWVDHMRKIPDRPVAELVAADHPDAKQAILHFRVLKRLSTPDEARLTLVEIELETGRMHQIRLQFSSRGYPLLGDRLYGAVLPFGPTVDDPREQTIALHSRQISFHHPKTGVMTTVVAPIPKVRSASDATPASVSHERYGWTLLETV